MLNKIYTELHLCLNFFLKDKLHEVFLENEIIIFQTNCVINVVHLIFTFGFFSMAIKKAIF